MGTGASAAQAENARNTINTQLADKPLDASDVKDLEAARAEIRQLRKLARVIQEQLREEKEKSSNGGAVKEVKKREAVMDKHEQVRGGADYVPKVIDKPEEIKVLLFGIVQSNILFSSYAYDEHNAIVDAFDCQSVTAGSAVIRQGENGDNFYVVESGTLEIYVRNPAGESKVGFPLGPGACFGELALMYNTPRAATVKASSDCVLWFIDRSCFRGILVYFKYLRNRQYMEFLRNVEIMNRKLGDVMTESELEKTTISLEREVFEPGDVIIRQGNRGDNFYIISEGDVAVYKSDASGVDQKLTVLREGSYFGEQALLKEDVRAASCVAETKVTCLTLSRDDFIDMMGTMEDMMSGTKKEPEPTVASIGDSPVTSSASSSFNLRELEIKNTLGCGAFGRVKLCRSPSTDQYYALKCQAKKAIVESGLEEHILNEMRVMRKVEHPFIAKLYAALQDSQYIYFVLELLQGGELFTHLRNRGKLTEQTARFYTATVVCAFASLHAKKIAYRDLKPENLVMNNNGYVKLVDFGLAKQMLSGKTWTLCGTPDYLAPEIILNEGHDLAVDYWALGVLIFEMVVGAPPFYAEDPMEVYEKILSGNPPIPTFFTRNLSDLIKKLLRSQQGKRLGNTRGGTSAIIKHKWFSSFDWAGLESEDMKAPYKPNVVSRDDVTNFDQFDEGDEPETSDWNPDLNS